MYSSGRGGNRSWREKGERETGISVKKNISVEKDHSRNSTYKSIADIYSVSPVRSNSLEMRRLGALAAVGWSACWFSLFFVAMDFLFLAATTGAAVVLLRVDARVTGLVITD